MRADQLVRLDVLVRARQVLAGEPVARVAVARGQAAVLYDGTRLLGGGSIAETAAAEQSCLDAAAA